MEDARPSEPAPKSATTKRLAAPGPGDDSRDDAWKRAHESLKSVASLGADQQMQVRADIRKIVDFDSRTLRGSFQRIVHAPLVTQE
jgi:hypothetical protein